MAAQSRPSKGTAGSPLRVATNSFEIVRRPRATYYHYDDIKPEVGKSHRAHEIIYKLQEDNPQVFTPRAVYDGRANLFSTRNINSGENPRPRGIYYQNYAGCDNPAEARHIAIVSAIFSYYPSDIDQLTMPGGAGANTNTMAVNLLQIIIRQAPNIRHGFSPDARSFFTSSHSKDLAQGLQAWHGFFQSVRPVLGRLLINVDVANAVVYAPGPLETLAMRFLNLRDVRDLDRVRPGSPEWQKLRQFLKGVSVTLKTTRSVRARPIKDLVAQGGLFEFEKDNKITTVQASNILIGEHFQQHHNIRLRFPKIFGVRIGKDAVLPAEVCTVAHGQVYKKKLSPEMQSNFLKFSTQRPDARLRQIQEGISGPTQVLDYATSHFIQEAGMEIGTMPININGRVLPTPSIKYQNQVLNLIAKSGKWNVVRQRLEKPGTLNAWAIVVFDQQANTNVVQGFVRKLQGNLASLGITTRGEPFIAEGHPYQVEDSLQHAASQSVRGAPPGTAPSLLLVLLPNSAAEIRRKVKHWGDVTVGVPTQCIRQGKWEPAKDQYCNNVALKQVAQSPNNQFFINDYLQNQCKDRGCELSLGYNLNASRYHGADVGHPGPGVKDRPSVTGLVASVDAEATRYTAYAGVQEPRTEIIANLADMLRSAIRDFVMYWKGRYPLNIVFYRDGVSEGEYAQVAAQEVNAINEVLLSLPQLNPKGEWLPGTKAYQPGAKPKLVFIVVGKRQVVHHIRFFPLQAGEADSSGNCPPGFVVDDQITNAMYPDFYLQSHSGIQGTSRPSHYIVIENELGLTADIYQDLSFKLCHVYASATRSVSIPAPVYYADRVCARAENHFSESLRFGESDAGTTVSGPDPPFELERWQNGFNIGRLNRQMFFL
ncbi:uncharacterized protein FIBRA_08018 [Fibroporia radiculosa]|uniref:Piwi domain-containing protein n=1 Tax=Fibroporia radiculosa TaxID=599839 RepID=J4GW15_9APHY|nr:uncharacterized protein FIBRA_08018 [Fibroporia radiculosa]CCM05785.1 predicted protein [Fibroporia radiculosa]